MARTYLSDRNYEEAVRWARKAIDLDAQQIRPPLTGSALGHLGCTYEAREAVGDCKRCSLA